MHPSVCALRRIHRPVCDARIARRALKHACALRPSNLLRLAFSAAGGARLRSPLQGRLFGGTATRKAPCKESCRRQPTEGVRHLALRVSFRVTANLPGLAALRCGACAKTQRYPQQASPAGVERRPYNVRQTGGGTGGGRHDGGMTVVERRCPLRRGRCLHRPADGLAVGWRLRVSARLRPQCRAGVFARRLGFAALWGFRADASIVPYETQGKVLPGFAGYLRRKAAMHPSVCALRRSHRPVCGARIARRALKHACALRPSNLLRLAVSAAGGARLRSPLQGEAFLGGCPPASSIVFVTAHIAQAAKAPPLAETGGGALRLVWGACGSPGDDLGRVQPGLAVDALRCRCSAPDSVGIAPGRPSSAPVATVSPCSTAASDTPQYFQTRPSASVTSTTPPHSASL